MLLIEFENLLKKTMGLDSASVGSATIESAVRIRMASLGFKQLDDYWEKLHASNEELQELIEAVIVPETWFFRDQDAFAVLGRLVSEEWLPNNPKGTLRLLSVPCCSGEEPYSMVMALLDMGLSRDQLKIDAVDISVRSLVRAKRGVYGPNSFRGNNLAFRDRYFDYSLNGYSLTERIRGIVTFQHDNLLSPDFRLGSTLYDVIFCRNVLIYFDRDTQERVMRILGRMLAPSGFLFVGPAEAFLAAASGFKSINRLMCFAFRKDCMGPKEPLRTPQARPARAVNSLHREPSHDQVGARTIARPPPLPVVPAVIDLGRARQLGNVGKFAEAAELCEASLKEEGPTSETYYLLGLVRDAMGDMQRAAECYRKVLYLDPVHSDALMHLALHSEKHGDIAGGHRLRERAKRSAKS